MLDLECLFEEIGATDAISLDDGKAKTFVAKDTNEYLDGNRPSENAEMQY